MLKSLLLLPTVFLLTRTAPPPTILKNLAINEMNLFAIGTDQYIEITDGDQGYTDLDNVFILFFDQYGNRYAYSDLTGIQTQSNGLTVIGTANFTDRWPKSIVLNSTAAVALYYLKGEDIPVNIELSNPGLLDGIVYRSPQTKVGTLVLALQELMEGIPLVEPTADDLCYDPQHTPPCDKGLSKCYGDVSTDQRRKGSSFMGAPLTPGEVNQCPLPYFLLNEVRVNPNGGVQNEFVEIRTADPNGKILRKSLNNVVLVGFMDGNIPVGDSDASLNTTFEVSLDGYSLNDNGLFTVGDPSYPCSSSSKSCINLPWTFDDEFLPTGSFGVALLWTPITFPTIRSAVQLRVIDSISYTTTGGPFPNRVVTAINLPNQDILFINSSLVFNGTEEMGISFARTGQNSFDISDLLEYDFATPTPDAPNDGSYVAPADYYYTDHKHLLVRCRINEIGLTVAREHQLEAFIPGGSAVTFDFVEVIGPVNTSSTIKLTGLLAVTYAGWADGNYTAIMICNCNTTSLNEQGIGVCPCDSKAQFNTSLAAFVATVLHVGTPEEFEGLSAADGAAKLYTDAVAYRTSSVDPQPTARTVRNYFIKGQNYDLAQPPIHGFKKLSYSYSRCFGVPEKEISWLAAYGLTYNVTMGDSNLCPPPMLTLSQFEQQNSSMLVKLDATHNGKEIVAAGIELPLDQAVLAAAEDRNGIATLVDVLRFGDVRIDPQCQNLIAGSPKYPFSFDVTKPMAIILYWDVQVPNVGSPAPFDGVLFSEVLTPENTTSDTPASLLYFATNGVLEADATGYCSLSKCDNQWVYANRLDPNNCLLGQCSACCKGLPQCPTTTAPTTTPQATTVPTAQTLDTSLFINELFYDYETKYSYVEIMTTRFGNPLSGLTPATNQYMLALYNASLHNVTINFPGAPLPFLQLKKKVIAFSDDPSMPNYGNDWSQLKLEEDGPGAICIYYVDYVKTDTGFLTYNVLCDCVVYTTNPKNTDGLAELQAMFDQTGYAVEDKITSHNYSISRCSAGGSSSGIAFVNSDATIGNNNECPDAPEEYCIAIHVDGMNCYTDGEDMSHIIFDAVVGLASADCSCLTAPINVNFANKTRALWSCTDDGNLQVQSTVWSVNKQQSDQFDRSIKSILSDTWMPVTAVGPDGKQIKAQYKQCYYKNKPFQPGVDFLLVTCIVVAVIAVVVSLLGAVCLCWNNCCGRSNYANGVIVPMQGRRIDKSAMDLVPATNSQGGSNMQLATTSSSSDQLIPSAPARRWTPPSQKSLGAEELLVHQEEPRISEEHL